MTTNAERAAILVRAMHAAVDGDRTALSTLYTPDVKAWTPAESASSAAELIAMHERRDDAFSGIELDVTPLDVSGDYACAEWRVSMTHTGDLDLRDRATGPATGLHITVNGVTVAEFEGERICSLRQYWDELAVYEQVGLVGDDGDA
jgi:ketosteroid isomerase-like protein